MITAVTHFTRYVVNADEALKFYTEVLGFRVHTDQSMGENMRWLTVCAPEQPSVEIVLHQVDNWLKGEQAELVLAAMHLQPQICVATNDIEGLQQRLKEHGVKPGGEIGNQPWGKDLSFRDLSGSPLYAVQPHPIPVAL